MLASDWIARFLAAQGVESVYEVVGGMIANLLDSLHRAGEVRIVSCHHEQAAGFAAEGQARMTGVPGVALGTSGPGALNLLTALGSCHFDSTPAVFITGQVNRTERKGERPIRQLGFQETDVVAIAGPIAKAAWRIETAAELPERLREAFALARSGRPGPVLVDIPLDLQRADIDAPIDGERLRSYAGPPNHAELPADAMPPRNAGPPNHAGLPADAMPPRNARPPSNTEHAIEAAQLARILDDLDRAERPLILAGGGLRAGGAIPGLRALTRRLGVPVVHSLMGVDALAHTDPLRVGMIGTYGNRWANIALARCDALLVLGSRLDIRQTGADTGAFMAGRVIHHVDCDPGEINNRLHGCHALVAQLANAMEALNEAAAGRAGASHESWRAEIARSAEQWPDTAELAEIEGINPNRLMHQISNDCAAAYVTDVGQHQMWAAQSLQLSSHQRFLTSGGMGAMGSGLPLAIGAAIAAGGDPVVLVAGDGGFQLNIQELQTVLRNELPLKMVILNNNCHGMVRQFQESYFEGRYQSTLWGYSAPAFAAVAAAYGIPARAVSEPEALADALTEMWATEGPHLLDIAIDVHANAYPKIAFGYPISEMEPFVKPKTMEAT